MGLDELKIGGRIETIKTIALLKSAWIVRRVLETKGDFLSLRIKLKKKHTHTIVSKKEGRGHSDSVDCVDESIQGFEDYIKKSEERLITATNISIGSVSKKKLKDY